MENLGLLMIIVLFIVLAFIQKKRIKFLEAKLDLLEKMFRGDSWALSNEEVEKIPLKAIEELRNQAISFYIKKIEEWGPDGCGDYFLGLKKFESDKKITLLMSLFKEAVSCLSSDQLVNLYFDAIKIGLEADTFHGELKVQTTKNLILEITLKEGKSSKRGQMFYSLLEKKSIELPLNKNQTLLFNAEIIRVEMSLLHESDRIKKTEK